jgi:hypothetical protein
MMPTNEVLSGWGYRRSFGAEPLNETEPNSQNLTKFDKHQRPSERSLKEIRNSKTSEIFPTAQPNYFNQFTTQDTSRQVKKQKTGFLP